MRCYEHGKCQSIINEWCWECRQSAAGYKFDVLNGTVIVYTERPNAMRGKNDAILNKYKSCFMDKMGLTLKLRDFKGTFVVVG